MSLTMVQTRKPTLETHRPKSEAIPYRGPLLPNTVEDLVHQGILSQDFEDKLWIPQQENVWFRPLLFNVSNGYFVNLLKVRRSGVVSRHRHTGPVHATVIKGSWHYLEHDWWVHPGDYAFEPPGDIHTLEVPEGIEEMITLFHVTGSYIYVDPEGKAFSIEDVFSKMQSARDHYEKVGLGADYVNKLIR